MDVARLALIVAALAVWMALVHFLMAFGVRRGELIWSGRQPRRLDPSLRVRSFIYGILLVIAAWTVAAYGRAIEFYPVPDRLMRSAGWVATAFFGCTAVYCLIVGSRWERIFFLPMTLFGAVVAGYLTFS